jgi:hypothetical protein
MFMPTRVPRIPAVPTGESILKLDFLSSFLMSTTMSPMLRSMRTSDELGSPSSSESFALPGSNLACVNFLIFRTDSDLRVETVPFERSSTTLALAPVLTVCPSNNKPPDLTRSAGKGSPVVLFKTVTSPSICAMIIAPLGSEMSTDSFSCENKNKELYRNMGIRLIFFIFNIALYKIT